MTIEDLRKKFIVDEDVLKTHLESLVDKALVHCKIDKQGQVLITNDDLSSKEKVMLVLAARAIANQLDPTIAQDVTAVEIGKHTGLPTNQVHARAKDVIAAKLAEAPKAGLYRAVPYKIEGFLDQISIARRQRKSES